MPTALITPESMLHKPAPYVNILRAGGFEVRYPKNPLLARGLLSQEEAIGELSQVEAVIAGGEVFSPAVIQALPKLRVIARAGVGYDRVDVPSATARRVAVTITPTANHEAVAEQAFALILACAKDLVIGHQGLLAGKWRRDLTEPIRGKTLGLLGLGRIGRSTALRGIAMKMRTIACEKFPNLDFVKQNGIELVSFDELLARSDYLSLHCPHCDETHHIMNEATLAKMKKGSTLINTARGKLVDERALLAALTSGHLRCAGLDVFEEEPPPRDNPLFALENVVLTPHLAGNDWLSLENMGIECAQSIVALCQNRWPEGAVVNEELRGSWKW
jgi:D-3-phosphoglycerate dehydrogenase / 2-oxoglutarate reductase